MKMTSPSLDHCGTKISGSRLCRRLTGLLLNDFTSSVCRSDTMPDVLSFGICARCHKTMHSEGHYYGEIDLLRQGWHQHTLRWGGFQGSGILVRPNATDHLTLLLPPACFHHSCSQLYTNPTSAGNGHVSSTGICECRY